MPAFRIHRLKPAQRQQFRCAPHTSGVSGVRPRDYEPAGSVEAAGTYAAWAALRSSEHPLEVGDLLETENGTLFLCKYVGFEEARWILPETPAPAAPAPGTGNASVAPPQQ